MPSDEVAADGNLSRTFSGAITPFTDVPRDWGCDLWMERQRTCWVGFSWLRYSVLTLKFFTFTERATTAKLLLGVSQALPVARRLLFWALPSHFPLVNHALNLFLRERRDGLILSQSFQGQADCPRHRVLRRMGEKEGATRSMPSVYQQLYFDPPPASVRGRGQRLPMSPTLCFLDFHLCSIGLSSFLLFKSVFPLLNRENCWERILSYYLCVSSPRWLFSFRGHLFFGGGGRKTWVHDKI